MEEKDLIRNRDKYGLIDWFQSLCDSDREPEAILRLRLALSGESLSDPQVLEWYPEYVAKDIFSKIQNYLNYGAIRLLVNQGSLPNTGYQVDEQNNQLFNLDETHSEIIRNFLPPDIQNYLCQSDRYSSDPNPVESVEQDLGVPFFKNLIVIIKMRIRFLDHRVLGTYLEEMIHGISTRLGFDLTEELTDPLPQEILALAVQGGYIEMKSPVHVIDILSALGESQECLPDHNGNFFITERGFRELNKVYNPVWTGNLLCQAEYPENLV